MLAIPWYGVGTYVFVKGFSLGLIFCTIPFLVILLFHAIDLLYRGTFTPSVNGTFYLCCAALLSGILSIPLGLRYGSPILNPWNTVILMVFMGVPFLAAVVVQTYNRGEYRTGLAWLMVKGLILWLVVNLLGYAAGLRNLMHSFPGRISLPFSLGIYGAAHILAFLSLVLLGYLHDFRSRPVRSIGLSLVYVLNIAIMLSINSRLSIMIFMVITLLFILKLIKKTKGIFLISLFIMPIITNFTLLIYNILTLPFFASVLTRVSKKDVTTFNGRTYIWDAAADWIMHDRRGWLFGNGFNGQYHLRLLDTVAKLWGESGSYRLHMHSAFLEILVDQGVVGVILMYLVYWRGFSYYRRQYMEGTPMAPLYAGFLYLLFIWQIDIFGYAYNMGFMLLFVLMAPLSLKAAPLSTPVDDE
jgi:O-antigen ligase